MANGVENLHNAESSPSSLVRVLLSCVTLRSFSCFFFIVLLFGSFLYFPASMCCLYCLAFVFEHIFILFKFRCFTEARETYSPIVVSIYTVWGRLCAETPNAPSYLSVRFGMFQIVALISWMVSGATFIIALYCICQEKRCNRIRPLINHLMGDSI